MLLTNRFCWFGAGALGVERQRTGLKLGSEPALELPWWKRGITEVNVMCWNSPGVKQLLLHTVVIPHTDLSCNHGFTCTQNTHWHYTHSISHQGYLTSPFISFLGVTIPLNIDSRFLNHNFNKKHTLDVKRTSILIQKHQSIVWVALTQEISVSY